MTRYRHVLAYETLLMKVQNRINHFFARRLSAVNKRLMVLMEKEGIK